VVVVNVVVALLGLGFGAGLWLIWTGWRAEPSSRASSAWAPRIPADAQLRLARAGAGALALGATTRWPVAALFGAAVGWFSPELFGGRAARERAVARTEAIASWTEMLRDTMAGAHGLEETLVATAPVAPAAIAPEVARLTGRVGQEPLPQALRALADDLAHPTGDLVVAALTLAASGAVRDLGELLGTLAEAARQEAAMRLRVEATRARLRTAVRMIAACTLGTAASLVVLNPSYVSVYSSSLGQAALALIAAAWGTALWWLARMSEFAAPERFLTAGRATREAT
jgi:hypothetical protein